MKFNLKMIAAAAAMASLAGAAQASIVTESTNNGNLVLTAFNTTNNAWYIRDLGFTINQFMPTGSLASVGDPSSALVGDKTPNAGLTLNAGNTANFGDPTGWNTWIAAQGNAVINWNVNAVDTFSTGLGNGVRRAISSSANNTELFTNQILDNFVASSNAGSASAYYNPNFVGISAFNTTGSTPFQNSLATNFALGVDGLGVLGQSVSLFYAVRTVNSGTTSAVIPNTRFGNSTGFATVTLDTNGNFTYELAGPVAEVPLPAAAWLLGAGLMGVGAMIRRRKAAAEA